MYTRTEIRDTFNAYVSERQLINARDQQYINVGDDDALSSAVSMESGGGSEFMKREDALKRIMDNMESWHCVCVEGGENITM